MLITGLPYEEFRQIVCRVSSRQYDGNVTIADFGVYSSRRFHAAIRVSSSRGKGARRSASGRRIASACWHAHRDILIELFRLFPDARVRSGRIGPVDYKGADGFRADYPETGQADVGWVFLPVRITELCECGGNVPRTAAETKVLYEAAFAAWWAERQASRAADRAAARAAHRAETASLAADEPDSDARCEPEVAADVPGAWVNTISPA